MNPPEPRDRVTRVLDTVPLVDGHNDLPWAVSRHTGEPPDPAAYPLESGAPGHTDMARLRAGRVGAQFWAAWVPCEHAGPGAAAVALEQIDLVRRIEARLPELERCWSAAEVETAFARGRIASLLGVEGGHAIEGSLGVLRAFRALGARYLTLTHNCTHDWADSATDEARHGGLAPFGRDVVREMNRLGMLVDLSHVSPDTMHDALEVSQAPVVFSHSSARAVCDHPRNVPDDVLREMRRNGGIVMVTFVARFVSEPLRQWHETHGVKPPSPGKHARAGTTRDPAGADDAAVATFAEVEDDAPVASLEDVADHVEHVRDVAGVEHVGLGGDFDGTAETPRGLEDVSRFPALLEELARRGWSDDDLGALVGRNILRVMREAEQVAE